MDELGAVTLRRRATDAAECQGQLIGDEDLVESLEGGQLVVERGAVAAVPDLEDAGNEVVEVADERPDLLEQVRAQLPPTTRPWLFLPVAGIVDEEVRALQALEPVWARMRASVRLLPREMRSALRVGPDWLVRFDPPDVPTLYLYGEETDARLFPSPSEVPDLLPPAQLHGLRRQRHLGFAFDPSSFAHAILEFTATHDT